MKVSCTFGKSLQRWADFTTLIPAGRGGVCQQILLTPLHWKARYQDWTHRHMRRNGIGCSLSSSNLPAQKNARAWKSWTTLICTLCLEV